MTDTKQQDGKKRHRPRNHDKPKVNHQAKAQAEDYSKMGTIEQQIAPKQTLTKEVTLDDAEVCFICAEPIHFSAVLSCNHRTCHICSLRIRALYKDHKCSYCKTESKDAIFTMPSTRKFADYKEPDLACKDDKLSISFERAEIMEETMILLRFNCPVDTCDAAANGWPDLKVHVRQTHNELLCDLCVKNQKVFSHEHKLFSQKGLTQHYKFGDRGAQDTGFKGHPECGFCSRAFYDADELYRHCREKHERCHVCDQLENGPGNAQYFQDYKKLAEHFRRDHFVCPEQSCLDQKFIVFGSEIDLKAHQLEAHPHGLSGQALRDARKVQTSFAGYQAPQHARGNRNNRPEMTLQSSDRGVQSMTREELALHRQMEYQQSRMRQTGFGYALTAPETSSRQAVMQIPKKSEQNNGPPAPVEAFPALSGKNGNAKAKVRTKNSQNPSKSEPIQPSKEQSEATEDTLHRHQALLERVQMIASYDEEKVALYKTNIAQYRSTNITATELIDNLWSLFRVTVDALGSVVTGSADLLDSEARKLELRSSWNDWKLKNKVDKPITGSSMASVVNGSVGGQRVLNIKNRASRTANQTASVWSRSLHGATARDPVAQATQRLAQLSTRNHATYTPAWSAGNSTPASGTVSPINGRSGTAPEFPSLPASSQPRISTAQYFPKPQWGQQSVIGPEDYDHSDYADEPVVPMTKGKKKAKKQLIFSQGLQRG